VADGLEATSRRARAVAILVLDSSFHKKRKKKRIVALDVSLTPLVVSSIGVTPLPAAARTALELI
jgi:hypothetical protein